MLQITNNDKTTKTIVKPVYATWVAEDQKVEGASIFSKLPLEGSPCTSSDAGDIGLCALSFH